MLLWTLVQTSFHIQIRRCENIFHEMTVLDVLHNMRKISFVAVLVANVKEVKHTSQK